MYNLGKNGIMWFISMNLFKANGKDKHLNEVWEEDIIYKGTKIGMTTDFLFETMQAKRQWNTIIKILKGK